MCVCVCTAVVLVRNFIQNLENMYTSSVFVFSFKAISIKNIEREKREGKKEKMMSS